MIFIAKMAYRNLFRHKRRSLVNCLLIFVSVVVVYAATVFCNTVNSNMNSAVVDSCTGDLQIHSAKQAKLDLYSSPPADTVIFTGADRVAENIKTVAGVVTLTQRLRVQGLFATSKESTSSVLTGVIPEIEKVVSPKIKVVEGNYITHDDGVIIGQELQKKLDVKVGDIIYYYINKSDGTITEINMIVDGIFKSDGLGMYMDSYSFCNIDFLRNSMNYTSFEVTDVVIRIKDNYNRDTVLANIQKKLDAKGHLLEVKKWEDVANTYSSVIVASTLIPGAIDVFVIFVVILGLFNNIIMNFMERKKENGVLHTLGTSRIRLVGMFSSEYFILGLVTSALAMVIMIPAIYIIGKVGITAPSEIVAYIFGGYKLYLNINLKITAYIIAMFTLIPAIVAAIVSAYIVNKFTLSKIC